MWCVMRNMLFDGISVFNTNNRIGRLCPLRTFGWNYVAGNNQYFVTEVSKGGTAMFAFLALAGDLGATISPAMVGNISNMFGGNLKVGLFAATAFPLILIVGLAVQLKGKRKEKTA